MSSKIVGWLVGAWDGKFSDFTKNVKEKKNPEINLKKGNLTFLPFNVIFNKINPFFMILFLNLTKN